jgi:ribonuclease P protein component
MNAASLCAEIFCRLTKRQQFKAVSAGARVHTELFSLQLLRRREDTESGLQPRFGFTVTRKTGNAVERNRIRRRLRHALLQALEPAKPGHDYVVVARRPVLDVPFERLVAELNQALARGRERVKSRGQPS